MLVRDEEPRDVGAIRDLICAAFVDLPQATGREAAIVEALRSAGALTLSLVAVDGDAVVGHLALSPASVAGASGGWFALGPLAVTKDHRGQGVGGRLIREALRQLNDLGAEGLVVVGDPAYYGRYGFVHDPALTAPGVSEPYLQRILLWGAAPVGDVGFHPAFGV